MGKELSAISDQLSAGTDGGAFLMYPSPFILPPLFLNPEPRTLLATPKQSEGGSPEPSL